MHIKKKIAIFSIILLIIISSLFIKVNSNYKDPNYKSNIELSIPEIYNVIKGGNYDLIVKNTGEKSIKSFEIEIEAKNILGQVIDKTTFNFKNDKILPGDSKVYPIEFDKLGLSINDLPVKANFNYTKPVYISNFK